MVCLPSSPLSLHAFCDNAPSRLRVYGASPTPPAPEEILVEVEAAGCEAVGPERLPGGETLVLASDG